MKKSLLATIAVFALGAPAFAQSPQEHREHHPGGAATTMQAPAPTPAPAQPRGQMPMGQMMQNMPQGCMGMMQQMMQGSMRGMGAQGMAGGQRHEADDGRHRGHMMKVMFAVADTNGDGALLFEEVTAIHKRIFDHVDANKDGKVTFEELQSFMRE